MTAKEYLKQLRLTQIKIEQLTEEIRNLKILAVGGGSLGINPDKVQSSMQGDKLCRDVSKYVDLENELLTQKLAYAELRNKVIKEIHQLEDSRHVQILYLHYVSNKRLEEIACEMKKNNGEPYTYDHIKMLHGEALVEFQNKVIKEGV